MSPSVSNPLLGIWTLISATAICADGTIEPGSYGANPVGYIAYFPNGQMMVMFAKPDRPPLSQVVSPLSEEMNALPVDERAVALASFNAYAGRYRLEGNTVIHQIEIASIPNRVGTELTRTVTVSGDRITLKTPAPLSNGLLKSFELVWQRQ